MCSDNAQEYKEEGPDKKEINVRVSYCLSGLVTKESKDVIEGKLTLYASWYHYKANPSGEKGPGESNRGREEVVFNYKVEKVTSE